MDWGIALHRRNDGSVLLVTGGAGRHRTSEARIMQRIALDQGVEPDRILLEELARSTWENARECARIIRKHGWRRVILVTDSYHLPRGLLAFRHFGVRAGHCSICHGHSGTSFRTTALLYSRELAAIPWYVLRILVSRLTEGRNENA
jgi:uncharacterized SAM-binding protein YcdF (DUF218 family)